MRLIKSKLSERSSCSSQVDFRRNRVLCVYAAALTLFVLLACGGCASAGNIFAQNQDQQETNWLELYSTRDYIKDDGKRYALEPVFNNKRAALEQVKHEAANMLSELQSAYNIEQEMNESNWHDYENALMDCLKTQKGVLSFDQSNLEYLALHKFFSIYDNEETNKKIKANYKEYGIHGVIVELRGISTYENGKKVADPPYDLGASS